MIKHYALGMSGREIAEQPLVSKSGVNKFLAAFKACKALGYPLPEGITNYGIATAAYGKLPSIEGRDRRIDYLFGYRQFLTDLLLRTYLFCSCQRI